MNEWLLAAFVFAASVSMVMGIVTFVTGANVRRIRTRFESLADIEETERSVSAIRARYLRQLSPFERRLEQLPVIERLSRLVEQAGWNVPGWRVAGLSLVLAIAAGVVTALLSKSILFGMAAGVAAGALPWFRATQARTARMEQLEAQLPDALDLMARSLQAGNPMMESFRFVSEEMKPPISVEFGRAWSNVNYGVSLKACLTDMLDRNPSVSLRSLATAILVQRETGGNLAEILSKITGVLRARARFQRRLRTLTAEGRMSGWVLGLLPFVIAGLLSVTSPDYLPVLFHSPTGQKMMMGCAVLMVIGVIWMTRIVKIKV